jgi:Response regulator containing a CheY-like receiver domain and a GGDEF domain
VAERIRVSLAGRIVLPADWHADPGHRELRRRRDPAARTASELFAAADAAMYEAKRAGKNRVETAPDPVRQT